MQQLDKQQSSLVKWLLDAETPSIRYLAARNLLAYPENHPDVQSARRAIMTYGPVPSMLSKQTETGQWSNEHSYYTPKYVSTHWTLMLLTELCIDPDDAQFQRGVDYMLAATNKRMQSIIAANKTGWSCFWGNLLHYALYARRADDPRLQSILSYTLREVIEGSCRCEYNDCYSCAWGVVRSLWGLAELNPEQQPPEIEAALDHALTFLLESFNLLKANYPTPDNGKVHPLWFKLNFPLFYQADILFTLRVLAELDALDHPGTIAALDWLESVRQQTGYWRGSSPFRQRTWPLGDTIETSRWVSLHAAMILQKAGRILQ